MAPSAPPTAQNATILVVDDAPENLEVIQSILSCDYTVIVATSGEQALNIVHAQAPDLILLDIMMQGMDGYDVCRQLKRADATRDVPIIFVTARDQTEDEARGLELGAVDYIAKWVSPSFPQRRVIGCADGRQQAPSLGYRLPPDVSGNG